MKVYLVNPPASKGIKIVREGRCMQRRGAWTTVWPPVTLATMGGMLLKEGIEVKLSDCIVENIDYANLKTEFKRFNPDLVVINTATASIYSDLYCAKIAKEVSLDIKTLAFGIHVSVLPEEAFLLEPSLDFVIRGEPEFCFLEFVRILKQNGKMSEIRGLSYREDSKIYHNPERGFQESLNNLTFPAWELINPKNYLLPLSDEPFLLTTTSKGCPYSCIFCPAKPFYGNQIRFRNVEIVAEEMEYVKKKFGVKQFLIWSESFTSDRNYVFEFCRKIIDKKINVRWVCNSRVDKVDLAMLKIMKESGCWMIGYGIESGAQEILDTAKKNITIAQSENAIALAKNVGLEVTAHIIFGLPGETRNTMRQTIGWINSLPLNFAQFYCAVPWPSTMLYNIAKENGWLTTKNWGLYEQNYYILDMKTIAPKEVINLRRWAIFSFYFSPRKICYVLRKINSFKKLWIFLRMVRDFITWT